MAGRSAWFVGPSDASRSPLPSPPVVQLRSTVCGAQGAWSKLVETAKRISRPPKPVSKRDSVQGGKRPDLTWRAICNVGTGRWRAYRRIASMRASAAKTPQCEAGRAVSSLAGADRQRAACCGAARGRGLGAAGCHRQARQASAVRRGTTQCGCAQSKLGNGRLAIEIAICR